MPSLFDPIADERFVLLESDPARAPHDGTRAGDERIPNALMAEYYAQRARPA